MHICKLNSKFIGLAYDMYEPTGLDNSLFGLCYFDLYICKKCGKIMRENSTFSGGMSENVFNSKINELKNVGYVPLGQLVNNKSEI